MSGLVLLRSPQQSHPELRRCGLGTPFNYSDSQRPLSLPPSQLTYQLVDPLTTSLRNRLRGDGSGFSDFNREPHPGAQGIGLEIRNFAGAVGNSDRLRDPALRGAGRAQPSASRNRRMRDVFYHWVDV